MHFLVAGVTATSADSSPFPVKTASVLGLLSSVGCRGANLAVERQPRRQRNSEFHSDLCIRCIFNSLLSGLVRYISLGKFLSFPKVERLAFLTGLCVRRKTMSVRRRWRSWGRRGRGGGGWSVLHPAPSAWLAALPPGTGSTRWQCLPALKNSFNFTLTLFGVKYFIRRISSEQRLYFPSKNWMGKIVFIVFLKI